MASGADEEKDLAFSVSFRGTIGGSTMTGPMQQRPVRPRGAAGFRGGNAIDGSLKAPAIAFLTCAFTVGDGGFEPSTSAV